MYSLQEIFGGNAASDEYHIGRHVANLFVVQTYEGQSDIHGEYEVHSTYLRAQSALPYFSALFYLLFLSGRRTNHFYSADSGPSHYRKAGLCLE
jgi:hypothetical protein